MSGVDIMQRSEALRAVVPGATLRRYPSRWGLVIGWSCELTLNVDRAVSTEHADSLLRAAGEQMRLRAMRELGLRPIFDAVEAEVRQYREANLALQATLEQRDARIAVLEAALKSSDDGE